MVEVTSLERERIVQTERILNTGLVLRGNLSGEAQHYKTQRQGGDADNCDDCKSVVIQ